MPTTTAPRPALTLSPPADLTTVPDRNADAVTDLLAGCYGPVLREIARDAVSRAWMGNYLADVSAVLLDITEHARRVSGAGFVPTEEVA